MIHKLALSYQSVPDKLIWHFSSDGNYIVKSSYPVACAIHFHGQCSSGINEWRAPWQLLIPSKVQTIISRLCWNILPTCVVLYHMKISMQSIMSDAIKMLDILGISCLIALMLRFVECFKYIS